MPWRKKCGRLIHPHNPEVDAPALNTEFDHHCIYRSPRFFSPDGCDVAADHLVGARGQAPLVLGDKISQCSPIPDLPHFLRVFNTACLVAVCEIGLGEDLLQNPRILERSCRQFQDMHGV